MKREDVRNIAIVAHVDYGETTLVDQLLGQNDVLRMNQEIQERVMNPNDLERERGITILSENTAVFYKDTKTNIIDTLGHVDFGDEVERVLRMVDGAALIVDAYEDPMPQTKFVLRKALDLDLSAIICIDKIDGPEARPRDIMDEMLELIMDLGATDERLDCPFIYASARGGFAKYKIEGPKAGMSPLSETVINHIPASEGDPNAEIQVLTGTIDYNEFVGRIGIGRVDDGRLRANQECVLVNYHEPDRFKEVKIRKLYEFDGPERMEVQEAGIGSIVAIFGTVGTHIDDTICTSNNPEPIPFQKISEPTITVYFMVNDSPLADQEGKYITSRRLRDRLFKELSTDVSLRVEETDFTDCLKVSGHDELHLLVLIENIRREGFEFAIDKAEVLYRYDEKNRKSESMELAYVDVPEKYTGVVIQKLTSRKGTLQGVSQAAGGYSRLEFSVPSRGLIDYRGDSMTDTRGDGISDIVFDGYSEYKGDLFYRQTSSLVAFGAGKVITYGLFNAQERGTLFVEPGIKVYSGMVMGQSPKAEDIEINVCKIKKPINIHSSNADKTLKLTSPKVMSLEQALDFVDTSELSETTPENPCIRKKILDPILRKKAPFRNK